MIRLIKGNSCILNRKLISSRWQFQILQDWGNQFNTIVDSNMLKIWVVSKAFQDCKCKISHMSKVEIWTLRPFSLNLRLFYQRICIMVVGRPLPHQAPWHKCLWIIAMMDRRIDNWGEIQVFRKRQIYRKGSLQATLECQNLSKIHLESLWFNPISKI